MIFLASDHNGNFLGKEICELWNNSKNLENELEFKSKSDIIFDNSQEGNQSIFSKPKQKFDDEFDKIENLTTKFDPKDDYPNIAKLLAYKINQKNNFENLLEKENNSINLENLEQKSEQKYVLKNNFGVAICGTGQGICMSLNRFKGIRAGVLSFVDAENLAKSLEIVELLRFHNDANVLCLASSIQPKIAILLIQKFIQTPFSKEIRHIRRIQKLEILD